VLRSHRDWFRTREVYGAAYRALRKFYGREDFRICHVSVQKNHVHLIVEAANRVALSRGMRGFVTQLAREINAADGNGNRCGARVFRFRYHATQITTPRQARNELAYVLNNWRKHGEDWINGRQRAAKVDPYASGLTFSGWAGRKTPFAIPDRFTPLPVSPARTSLLTSEWERFGRIDPWEVPRRPFATWRF
jgi:REP element-mobilizing transposase RayT